MITEKDIDEVVSISSDKITDGTMLPFADLLESAGYDPDAVERIAQQHATALALAGIIPWDYRKEFATSYAGGFGLAVMINLHKEGRL